MKLELGQQIGGELLIAKPRGSIVMMGQSEILSSSQIKFFTLFSAGAESCFLHLSPATASDTIMLSQNHFHGPNGHIFDFSSSNSSVQDHILSTVGDALSKNHFLHS